MVERCFGVFLDEIIDRGGDVNETAGDGLMAIFKDPSPTRHARAAVLTALDGRVRFISITIDPVTDRPDVLRRYADANGIDLASWDLLTGAPDDVARVIRAFGLSAVARERIVSIPRGSSPRFAGSPADAPGRAETRRSCARVASLSRRRLHH